MCQEVFEMVQNMDTSHVETRMALQCAPLITGIKISNLLTVSTEDETNVRNILKKSGIIHYRMLRQDDKTTFLLFYKNPLIFYLQDSHVQQILRTCGYTDFSIGGILRTFQCRYETYMNQGEGFPHEMGLLLGYPVEDVQGFIENRGQNYLYSGYWKVYENVFEKKQIFDKYENAKEQLILLLAKGYRMREIIDVYSEKIHMQAS